MSFQFDSSMLVARRRHLHAHPELSFQERETQQYVLAVLSELGLSGRPIARTGVVCRVGPQQGPAIALRADLDALPLQEKTGLSFASVAAGVMHACGHDGHTACLLTVAETIRDWPLRLGVVLLFQPAEEGLHGARLMVEEGCLRDVVSVVGLHLWSTMPVGQVGVSPGPVMANSDRFVLTCQGRGGHGSAPHQAADPVLAAAEVVVSAQQIVSRNIDPVLPAVVSFGGVVSSSNAPNVIPDSVRLCGTCRCYSDSVRSDVERRLKDVCSGVALTSGVSIDCQFTRGYDAVLNDPETTTAFARAVDQAAEVVPAPKVLGGEDFFYYVAAGVPGCFAFVGAAIDDGRLRPHHAPEFDIDERSLSVAVNVWLAWVESRCLAEPDQPKGKRAKK